MDVNWSTNRWILLIPSSAPTTWISWSIKAVCLHKTFFLWSLPRRFTSLFAEEMEESFLVMIQLLFEVKLLISTSALITHSACFLLMAHSFGNRCLCLSLTHGILSAPGLEAHNALPCHVLHAQIEKVSGGYLFVFWFRKIEEKNQQKLSDLSFFPPEHLDVHQSPIFPLTVEIWENIKTLYNPLLSSSALTNCRYLFIF